MHTITSTYHDGTLKVYTIHPTQASNVVTQLNTFGTTVTAERFRDFETPETGEGAKGQAHSNCL